MVISQTPLRISFLGGGTDFKDFYMVHGGGVVSAAIDKYIFVIVKERFDDKIYINYSEKEIVSSVENVRHELVREAMKMTGVTSGVEITTLADIPSEGSGLGSSSSLTVGLLNALYTHAGEPKAPEILAQQACEIEIDILGKPIGVQDQYIAAYGNLRKFDFNKDGTVTNRKMTLTGAQFRDLGENLMLFFTNRTRKSESILTEQKDKIRINVPTLCQMTGLAVKAENCLNCGDLYRLGELMNEGWRLKKSLASKIADAEIDNLYESALSAGALGGKIAGAGGGGFLLVYCPLERRAELREKLSQLREFAFNLEYDGTKIIFNYRRSTLK
ncbi:MAG: GHMP kinase [candidate division Zixibacteria bacterium CG_4_9_14_3_um_filter_46_8]|nr:MAG: GHMP kinase [candidate division Zixibacteria bacterium CG_4_9_14_3_um_filter_46_8]